MLEMSSQQEESGKGEHEGNEPSHKAEQQWIRSQYIEISIAVNPRCHWTHPHNHAIGSLTIRLNPPLISTAFVFYLHDHLFTENRIESQSTQSCNPRSWLNKDNASIANGHSNHHISTLI
eukprot:672092_1